jgi:hypothetical protein
LNNFALMCILLLLGVIIEFIGTKFIKYANKRRTFSFIVWGVQLITFNVLWFLENS